MRYNCVPRMCRFGGEERQEDGVGRREPRVWVDLSHALRPLEGAQNNAHKM